MRPLRVVHLLDALSLGGAEYNVIRLVNALDRARFAPVIGSLRDAKPEARALVAPDVPVWEFHRREGRDLGLVPRLARRLRADHADIVHTHNWATYLYGVAGARLAGVRGVVHGEHGLERDNLVERPARVWARRALAGFVDRLVGVSGEICDRMALQYGVPRERIVYIPNGVDLGRFGTGISGDAVRAERGIAPDAPVIVSIGAFRPVKDFETLVRAFSIVHANHPAAHLLLVGSDEGGRFERGIREASPAVGPALANVHFLGLRLDTPEILAAADVYANSSLYEGMSNTILEAMACRKPVVATAVGGTPDLVTEGVEGFLVPPRDPAALAERIARLLEDRETARLLGERGRARVERDHSFAAMIARNAEIYESLFPARGAAAHR
ncbi:MAG TPA: glycosyltransferase [Candidatus Eisenbacteria bacterium]|nr:glycosyltransferase [Candidatus Eisenbacteria bacterium]